MTFPIPLPLLHALLGDRTYPTSGYTPDETRLWLHTSHPMLENKRAIDLINAGRTEEVLAVIEALDSAAWSRS